MRGTGCLLALPAVVLIPSWEEAFEKDASSFCWDFGRLPFVAWVF